MQVFNDIHELSALMRLNEIDLSLWGHGTAKSLDDLWREISSGEIDMQPNPFRRVLKGVVSVIIRNGDKVLVEHEQILADGRRRSRDILPSEKMKMGESYSDAAIRCLAEELHIARENVAILKSTYQQKHEFRQSGSYPGLLSEYIIHTVEAQVIGLPNTDFWTAEHNQMEGQHHWVWKDAATYIK